MSENTAHPCPQCQIGHLQPTSITYVHMHHGMLVSVPDMPARLCDVCQYQAFEHAALLTLKALMGYTAAPRGAGREAFKSVASDAHDTLNQQRLKP
jgi:hypothetical protein